MLERKQDRNHEDDGAVEGHRRRQRRASGADVGVESE